MKDPAIKPVFDAALLALQQVRREKPAGATHRPVIQHDPASHVFPLSFAQNRIWFLDQYEPGSNLYNMPAAVRLRGKLNIHALQMALDALVARHAALRTTFSSEQGTGFQRVSRDVHVTLTQSGLAHFPPGQRETELQKQAEAESRRPFDITKDLLLRAHLVRIDARDHALILCMHHIVSDGWSLGVLNRELSVFYNAFNREQTPALADLPFQFGDFAAWQQKWLSGTVLDHDVKYWKQKLSGDLPVIELPISRPRPPVQSQACASLTANVAGLQRFKQLCERESATLFMGLLAAFHTLLHRYTGQTDILTGSPVAGRSITETENLIGLFVNTLVLRGDTSGNPTFVELLRRTRSVALEAFDHQDVPFEKLVEALNVPRSQSHAPVVQILFGLQNTPLDAISFDGLASRPISLPEVGAKFEISLYAFDQPADLELTLDYNSDLFDKSAMERLLHHFQVLLNSVAEKPELRLLDLPLLDESESAYILRQLNDSSSEFPSDACLHQRIEAQVASTPDATAVLFENESLTYAQLNARANQLARHLQRLGVKPQALAAVCLDRSIDMLVAVLAVLKSGAAYLPLDPEHPAERLSYILQDAHAAVLITQSHLQPGLPANHAPIIALDLEAAGLERYSEENFQSGVKAQNLAYVIYTSGSTGKPKGAGIEHRSVVNLFESLRHQPGIEATDTLLAATTLSFDIATLEMFLPLTVGARIHIVSRDTARDGHKLLAAISSTRATIVQATPATWRLLLMCGWEPGSRIKIFCGGEAMAPELAHQLLRRSGALWNMYGPTETTIYSVIHKVEHAGRNISIGRPVANTSLYVLNEALQPVPLGMVGELFIGGAGLAHGYINRPALTAERFIPDPFGAERGARLYRTGDLARYRDDGNVDYLGRIDHQVKIRGYRIELGEIEATLAQHPALRLAVVTARNDASGEQQLVAYFMVKPAASAPRASDLRAFLLGQLPAYMVPAFYVPLETLPLSPNGKVDRKALPAPGAERVIQERAMIAPRNDIENALADIWQQVLHLEKVSIDADFFELGGHSLLATQLVSRVRSALNVDLSVKDFFTARTIVAVAERVAQSKPAPVFQPIQALNARIAPLSFAQQRLWFLDQLQPGNAIYNVHIALRLRGHLNRDALRKALNALTRRHACLRTRFVDVDGEVQQTARDADTCLFEISLAHGSLSDRTAELQRRLDTETNKPFDLVQDELFRSVLFEMAADDHALLIVMHHIITDGWSLPILTQDLAAFYDHFATGAPLQLAEFPVQYFDFCIWQRDHSAELIESPLAFWKEKLKSPLPVLELPFARSRPTLLTHAGAQSTVEISRETSSGILSLCEREGLTPFMLFMSTFQALLHRFTTQTDILIGSPIAGRTRLETEGLVGLFVNTVVFRTNLSGRPTFRELFKRTRETAFEAFAHQGLPFEKLVEALNLPRDRSRSPLFQILFAYEQADADCPALKNVTTERIPVSLNSSKFDLTLFVTKTRNGFSTTVEYNTALFDSLSISRLQHHFAMLLSAAIQNPMQRIDEASLLSESDQSLLHQWNDTATPYPARCIHELFESQAQLTPHAIALMSGDTKITYAELNARANQVARHLDQLGVRTESMVSVCMDRTPEMVISILAILKLGAVYAPLDPFYPAERLAFMIKDTRSQLLLTQQNLAQRIGESFKHVILIDSDWAQFASHAAGNLKRSIYPDTLAYVMYTSGSTGQPKGVSVTHRAVVRLVKETNFASFSPDQIFMHAAPLAFDASTFELWGPLLNGARLLLYAGDSANLDELARTIERHKVTTLWLTAGLFHQMVELHSQSLVNVKQLLAGGDVLSPEHVRKVVRQCPGCRLINGYGPTENTTFTCCFTVPSEDAIEKSVPIGKPISNSVVYILDGNLRPVPIGIPGELYIGGDGLARGYLNQPALTANVFIPDPFGKHLGARMYKSGDLARFLTDGTIEFLGRVDCQVKIRGYRIELGEIEAQLARHPDIEEAAVVVREPKPGDKRLAAFIVLREGAKITTDALKSHLKARLPSYMIPGAYAALEKLPLNENGKVNRGKLPTVMIPIDQPRSVEIAMSPIEKGIATIWEELLGVPAVSLKDDFFELGGHSLLVASMMNRVSKLCGKQLPLSVLFNDATLEGLAKATSTPVITADTGLLTLRATGSKPPLFYLDGDQLTGGVYAKKFVEHLDDRPFYLVRPCKPGPHASVTIEQMTEEHLKRIRSVAPHGPYCLGGFCTEALVAFEMAKRLRASGEIVPLVFLVDPPTIGRLERMTYVLFNLLSKALRLSAASRFRLISSWLFRAETLRSVMRHPLSLAAQIWLRVTRSRPKNTAPEPAQTLDGELISALLLIGSRYRITDYGGRVILVQASATQQEHPETQKLWNARCKDLVSITVETTHFGLVTDRAHEVARHLSQFLEPRC